MYTPFEMTIIMAQALCSEVCTLQVQMMMTNMQFIIRKLAYLFVKLNLASHNTIARLVYPQLLYMKTYFRILITAFFCGRCGKYTQAMSNY